MLRWLARRLLALDEYLCQRLQIWECSDCGARAMRRKWYRPDRTVVRDGVLLPPEPLCPKCSQPLDSLMIDVS